MLNDQLCIFGEDERVIALCRIYGDGLKLLARFTLVSFAGQIAEPKIIFGGIIVIPMAMQGDEPVASGVVLYC